MSRPPAASGGLVEAVDRGAILATIATCSGLFNAAFAADPEIRLAVGAEAGRGIVPGLLLRHLHDEP